LSRKRTSIRNR